MNSVASTFEFLSETETKEILDLLLECKNPHDVKDKVLDYYKTNKRHRYSFIASYIMSKADKTETSLSNICENLRALIDNISEDNSYKYKLEKLYDHINLELIRMNYIKNISILSPSDIKDIKSSIHQSEMKIRNINKNNQSIKEELKNSRTQYITILGIFASIVVTFVAGISFSSAVLSNIGKVSFYKLILIMCFIAFFVGNILYSLYGFIRDVNKMKESETRRRSVFVFDIIVVLVAVVTLIFSAVKSN